MPATVQAPYIPALQARRLDPQALKGQALPTYLKFDNPVVGDMVWQSWLGLAEDGRPVDITNVRIPVDAGLLRPEGLKVEVAYDVIEKLNNGHVFYSFFLQRQSSTERVESNRIYFTVGDAAPVDQRVAPLIKESHDLHLNPDTLPEVGSSYTLAVVPYGAMSVGDQVQPFWQGVDSNGNPGNVTKGTAKRLVESQLNSVLSWEIPRTNFMRFKDGRIALWYEITYAVAPQATTTSGKRVLLLKSSAQAELAAASVKGLSGTVIDPGKFRDGLVVQVPLYPGIALADRIVVFGTRLGPGNAPSKNTYQHLVIDQTHIDSGKVEVLIPPTWLASNHGGQVALRYHYARANASGSSAVLALSVDKPLFLPAPTVDDSVPGRQWDELEPMRAINGAFIRVPEAAELPVGAKVTARWAGFGSNGSRDIGEPLPGQPVKFKVPPEVIPANFDKTVQVMYSVNGQDAEAPLTLFVRPLTEHSSITCEHVGVGTPATLRLADIPKNGAAVTLGGWPFIATAQIVRVWLTAANIAERDIIAPRRVLAAERNSGVKGRLLAAHLAGLANGAVFMLRASVSFDGGHSTLLFNQPLQLTLLA